MSIDRLLRGGLVALAVSGCIATGPAVAQSSGAPSAPSAPAPAADRFEARVARDMQRIERGERSGQLTGAEASRLREREARLQALHSKMAADGKITPRERHMLREQMERQSRAIHHERHDRQHDFNHDGKLDRPARQAREAQQGEHRDGVAKGGAGKGGARPGRRAA